MYVFVREIHLKKHEKVRDYYTENEGHYQKKSEEKRVRKKMKRKK